MEAFYNPVRRHSALGYLSPAEYETRYWATLTPQAAEPAWTPPSTLKRWLCGAAQALTIPGLVVLRMAQWLAPFFTYHFFTGDPDDSIALAVTISVAVFLLATAVEFAIAAAGKWLILGRLKPGRYPLWGLTYFRWWIADRLIEGAPAYNQAVQNLLLAAQARGLGACVLTAPVATLMRRIMALPLSLTSTSPSGATAMPSGVLKRAALPG